MATDNPMVDERDQDFVLYDMLDITGVLGDTEKYGEYTRDVIEMTMDVARKLAAGPVYDTLMEADREGCTWKDGEVTVPSSYHKLKELFQEGGWGVVATSQEAGGLGFPYTVNLAVMEGFISNFAFTSYIFLATGAAHLIEKYGTDEQKKKYMEKMYAGEWGGTMALTEPDAGSDVGSLTTKAVRQEDGTFRIQGSKIFITAAENDLFDNIVNPVLARIEGDPAGTKGISIFLVPKYLVNDDGSPGRRNDYTVTGIEHKMGIKGSATCAVSFGENGDCYAELLGEERQGMKIMFQLMNEARIAVGLQGEGAASASYRHALLYARERLQGKRLTDMQNPDAPKAAIIEHPDVKRMLLWMKSHVDGMRALVYYCGLCHDRTLSLADPEEIEYWQGLLDLLTPVCKAYCSDIGFRVAETAVQVYGGYGYCQDYPVEQFLRDVKIASIYEGTNGIQALDLVGRKLAQKGGVPFMNLMKEIHKTIERARETKGLEDLAMDLQEASKVMSDTTGYFTRCAQEGKFLIPVAQAVPFLNLMGTVLLGWFHLWQATVASPRYSALLSEAGIDAGDREKAGAFLEDNSEAAFMQGKVKSARYYIRNVLPGAEALARAIQSEDKSVLSIHNESF